MNALKPTQLTTDCCRLLLAISPTAPEKLLSSLFSVAEILSVSFPDCVALYKRAFSLDAPPEFDGVHDEAEWYNNNIQIPRLLIAFCEHFGIADKFPKPYSLHDSDSTTLKLARIFLDQYIHAKSKEFHSFSGNRKISY
jgi:hypothetical protein